MSKYLNKKSQPIIKPPYQSIKLIQKSDKDSFIIDKIGNKYKSRCIGCANPRCMCYEPSEIQLPDIAFPFDKSINVCPTNAISRKETGTVLINKNKCIGCGLCSLRCPLGSIHLKEGSADVEIETDIIANPSQNDLILLKSLEDQANKVKHTGSPFSPNKNNLYLFLKLFDKLQHDIQFADILVRNIFISIGWKYGIRRHGDNVFRIDGIAYDKNKLLINEVELSDDVLEAPRSILDDIAIYNYKFKSSKSSVYGLITLRSLPNNRAELWNVIHDIEDILKIHIDVVTIGTLLLLSWHDKKTPIGEKYFYDVDLKNRKILLDNLINMSEFEEGFENVFEPKK